MTTEWISASDVCDDGTFPAYRYLVFCFLARIIRDAVNKRIPHNFRAEAVDMIESGLAREIADDWEISFDQLIRRATNGK